jgi:hypothetical protein
VTLINTFLLMREQYSDGILMSRNFRAQDLGIVLQLVQEGDRIP